MEGRGDASRLVGVLMQVTAAALLLYAVSSGRSWLFFSIPCGNLLVAGAVVHFGGVRVRYASVGRRQWRSGRGVREDDE